MNISIANPGFEEPALEEGTFTDLFVPGWQAYDPSNVLGSESVSSYGSFNPTSAAYPGGNASEGNNILSIYLEDLPGSGVFGLSQTLSDVLTANTSYKLAVDVGNHLPDDFSPPGFPGYAVQLLAGNETIAQSVNALNLAGGTFGTATVEYTTKAIDRNLGKPLSIRLLHLLQDGARDMNFDNVRLEANPAIAKAGFEEIPPGLFNEAYYLQNNPDIAGAVGSGLMASGLEHFNLKGIHEGRTLVTPYFNEASYLQKYVDVANAVTAGAFSSGLEHFVEFGYNEGRSPDIAIPGSGDIYLRKYSDVAIAVTSGIFRSWYDHFLQFGLAEDRSPTYFDSNDYLLYDSDAVAAVADPNDDIVSAFDHFARIGQFEEKYPIFSATGGNDVVQGFGLKPLLFGIDFKVINNDPSDYLSVSTGFGEIDTLIGSPGAESFELGHGTSPSNPNGIQYYVGGGASDYAIIRNFEKGVDVIDIADPNPVQQVQNGNLSLFSSGDLVAVLEGVTTPLTPTSGSDFAFIPGTFFFT